MSQEMGIKISRLFLNFFCTPHKVRIVREAKKNPQGSLLVNYKKS